MVSRIPRLVILLAAGLVLVAGREVAASSARLQSLGGSGDFCEDSHNVLRWFGSLPDYEDLVVLELGDFLLAGEADRQVRNQGIGVHLRFDAVGRWGAGALYVADVTETGQLPGSLGLLLARRWGGFQVGLGGGWSSREWFTAGISGGINRHEETTRLGVGLRFDLQERLYLDLAGEWILNQRRYHGWTTTLGKIDTAEQESRAGFSWRARAFWGVTEKVVLVPVVCHLREDFLAFLGDCDQLAGFDLPADLDAHTTGIGCGVNLFPDADNLLLCSYEFRFGETTWRAWSGSNFTGRENCYHSHRLRIGVESRLASWLTLRGGAVQQLRNVTSVDRFASDTAGVETRLDNPRLDFALGLACHLAAWDLDLAYNDESPLGLGAVLTGAGDDPLYHFASFTLTRCF